MLSTLFYSIDLFPECHVDEHCKPALACLLNTTNVDEDNEDGGECVDPCLDFKSNCNNQTESCFVKNHQPSCVGKKIIHSKKRINSDI